MKQIALSLFVIASSGAYVWDQAGTGPAGDMIETAGPARSADDYVLQPTGQVRAPVPAIMAPALPSPASTVVGKTRVAIDAPSPHRRTAVPAEWTPAGLVTIAAPATSLTTKPVAYIPIPKPKPSRRQVSARIIKAAMKSPVTFAPRLAQSGYADGTYTGPVTDAYYGPLQIQALVRGGRLVALKVLRYPSDRRTSIYINRQALPMLRDEAIAAQSAYVDIISGATLTSRAFIESLGGALMEASS